MKPRNHVVVALLKRRPKAGPHGKSQKATRRAEKMKLSKECE